MMLRKLTEQDRAQLMNFVGREPAINLFIIGDVEQFGFDKDFQEVWGDYDEQGNLEGVLLRYNENFVPYFIDESKDIEAYIQIINTYSDKRIISGKESIVQRFEGIFENVNKKSMYFCEMKSDEKLLKVGEGVKKAVLDDAPRIYELLAGIVEFTTTDSTNPEKIRRNMEAGATRKYYIEDETGEMVSIAQTAAENSKSAMVVGVATKVGYRGRGYMSTCLSMLCKELLDEGKSLCLFYDNPAAGSIYHRVGFETIGRWTMLIEQIK